MNIEHYKKIFKNRLLQIIAVLFVTVIIINIADINTNNIYAESQDLTQLYEQNFLVRFIPSEINNIQFEFEFTENTIMKIEKSIQRANKHIYIYGYEDIFMSEINGEQKITINNNEIITQISYITDFEEEKTRKYNFEEQLWENTETQNKLINSVKNLQYLNLYDIDENALTAKIDTEDLKMFLPEKYNTLLDNEYAKYFDVKMKTKNNYLTSIIFSHYDENNNGTEIKLDIEYNIVQVDAEEEELNEEEIIYQIGKYDIKDIRNVFGYSLLMNNEELYENICADLELIKEENKEEYKNMSDEDILIQIIEKNKITEDIEKQLFENGVTLEIDGLSFEFPVEVFNSMLNVENDVQSYKYETDNKCKFFISTENGVSTSIIFYNSDIDNSFSLNGVKLNYTVEDIKQTLGKPKKIFMDDDDIYTTYYYVNNDAKIELYIKYKYDLIYSIELVNFSNIVIDQEIIMKSVEEKQQLLEQEKIKQEELEAIETQEIEDLEIKDFE